MKPTAPHLQPPKRRLLRFWQLQELGVVGDWHSLYDLIKHHGFDPGYKISHKVRVWDEDTVLAWLETRRAA